MLFIYNCVQVIFLYYYENMQTYFILLNLFIPFRSSLMLYHINRSNLYYISKSYIRTNLAIYLIVQSLIIQCILIFRV